MESIQANISDQLGAADQEKVSIMLLGFRITRIILNQSIGGIQVNFTYLNVMRPCSDTKGYRDGVKNC